jgi:hypothetical protein
MNSEPGKRSYSAIEKRETLMSPVIVFGELMPQFNGSDKEVQSFLSDHKIGIHPLDIISAVAGGKAVRRGAEIARKKRLKLL